MRRASLHAAQLKLVCSGAGRAHLEAQANLERGAFRFARFAERASRRDYSSAVPDPSLLVQGTKFLSLTGGQSTDGTNPNYGITNNCTEEHPNCSWHNLIGDPSTDPDGHNSGT